MNDKLMAIISDKRIYIPKELYFSMEKPDKIQIIPIADPHIAYFRKFNGTHWSYLISRIWSKLTRLKKIPKLITLKSLNEEQAEYEYSNDFDFKHTKLFIVNYHPGYYLMHENELDESESREKSWQEIENYHEHLKTDLQDQNASRVSDWLSKEIFSELGGKTFLETGCGAGRNLLFIHKNIPGAATTGIDINKVAIEVAKEELKNVNSKQMCRSLYDLSIFPDQSFDVVFSSGVLMHIPRHKVEHVIREMNRIAKIAVVHFELDGPSHDFDYHRYPRDYEKIYNNLFIQPNISYERFPSTDFRSNMAKPFSHSLLIHRKPA